MDDPGSSGGGGGGDSSWIEFDLADFFRDDPDQFFNLDELNEAGAAGAGAMEPPPHQDEEVEGHLPVVARIGEEEQHLLQQQQQAMAIPQQHPAVPVPQPVEPLHQSTMAQIVRGEGLNQHQHQGPQLLVQDAGTSEGVVVHAAAVPVVASIGVLQPWGAYDFSTVDQLITLNDWGSLENYLRRYMPVHNGHQNEHAEVILRCRSQQLLLLLNKKDYAQAKDFLKREIEPLGEIVSPYVNTGKLIAEIKYISSCVSENRAFENLETNVKDAINDYMHFYLGIGIDQGRSNSTYWMFVQTIERTRGKVTFRCQLCHIVVKSHSIKEGVQSHIGGDKCQSVTPYARQPYEKLAGKETESQDDSPKKRKVEIEELLLARDKKAKKHGTDRLNTDVKAKIHGTDRLNSINKELDEVLVEVGAVRALGKGDLNPQVERIIELVRNIRHSVHEITGATGQMLSSHNIPGVDQTLGLPSAPAPGDMQAEGNVPPHLNAGLDRQAIEEGATNMLEIATEMVKKDHAKRSGHDRKE